MRWWLVGTIVCLVGCSSAPQRPTASPPQPEARRPIPTPGIEQRLLALYDLAGFPDVAREQLYLQVRGERGGHPLCEVGVELEDRGIRRFLRADLTTTYDSSAIDRIPEALRSAAPIVIASPSSLRPELMKDVPGGAFHEPIKEPRAHVLRFDAGPQMSSAGACIAFRPSEGSAAEMLHWLGRAAWRRDWNLAEARLPWPEYSDGLEQRMRGVLCEHLLVEADRARMAWMPREHVAAVLARASALCPSAGSRDLAAELARWSPHRFEGPPGSALYYAGMLGERGFLLDPAQLAGAGWDPLSHLVLPRTRLASMGGAAVPALLFRMRDPVLTHAGSPVGEVALEVLANIAFRGFRTAKEAEAWWQEVRGLSVAERIRVALRAETARTQDALLALVVAVRARALPDLQRHVEVNPAAVAAALRLLVRSAPGEVAGPSRIHEDVVALALECMQDDDVGPLEDALLLLLEVAPRRALDEIARLDPWDLYGSSVWQVALLKAVGLQHHPALRRARRAAADPFHPLHPVTVNALTNSDGLADLRVPSSLSAAIERGLSRRLSDSTASEFDLAAAQSLAIRHGLSSVGFEPRMPLTAVAARVRPFVQSAPPRSLASSLPRRPLTPGPSGVVVDRRVVAPTARVRRVGTRWLRELGPEPVGTLGGLIEAFQRLAIRHPAQHWSLVVARYAGHGTTLWLGATPHSPLTVQEGWLLATYRDGRSIVDVERAGSSAAHQVAAELERKRTFWDDDNDPPLLRELILQAP